MKKLIKIALVFIAAFSFVSLRAQDIVPHFNHTTIYVTDLQKSSDFYEKVMLLTKIAEPFHDNKHTWFKIADHSELHVVAGATAVGAHDINIHLAFTSPNLDKFMAHLDEMHIKYGNWKGDPKVIQMRPDNIRQIYFQDPEGYWIEVNDDKF